MPPVPIQQAFNLALQHHQAGRLREAEAIYRQILAQQPLHAESLNLLGAIANQVGRNDAALELIGKAIAVRPHYAEAHCNYGNALKDLGRVDEAVAAYRKALSLDATVPEAHANLGNSLRDKGLLDEAMLCYRKAIALRPNFADAYCNLGNALRDKGELDPAIGAYRQAIVCNPNFALAYSNLSVSLNERGKFDEAIWACSQALALRPDYAEAHHNLGVALWNKGRSDEAIAAYRRCIALKPTLYDAYFNLGNILKERGEFDQAIAVFGQVIASRPDFAEAYSNIGNVLREAGRLEESVAACRRAIALKPEFAGAYSNLGTALKEQDQLDEAVAAYRQAIALRPTSAEAYGNLGSVLKDKGQLDEAIAAYRKAISLNPKFHQAYSNLLYSLHFHPGCDAAQIAEEHRRWNRQFAESAPSETGHRNDRTPERRLRIGYVSPDFRGHVVGQNLLPLFWRHDHQQFEITCYSQTPHRDKLTQEFQKHADRWRDIAGLSDDAAAQQIREDKIDILVDLALHMANNRLGIFVRKPAPIQVTFAGYPGSTGLTAIDYRLSDPYLDPFDIAQGGPSGMDESVYSEKTIRLADSFWCYDPLDVRDLLVTDLPAAKTGIVTFGCLNNFCKINDVVLSVWAQAMKQVKGSRLLLQAPLGDHRKRTFDRLHQEGVDPSRVEFVLRQPRWNYLQLYRRIDLGLDSFPYNGHTTSLDSYWMGVPVVTLVGQRVVSRAGWCQLSNLGLTELAGHTPEEFIKIAVSLANDLPRLAQLRQSLRTRMEHSPLMDALKFARSIEAAYRQMWRAWCGATATSV